MIHPVPCWDSLKYRICHLTSTVLLFNVAYLKICLSFYQHTLSGSILNRLMIRISRRRKGMKPVPIHSSSNWRRFAAAVHQVSPLLGLVITGGARSESDILAWEGRRAANGGDVVQGGWFFFSYVCLLKYSVNFQFLLICVADGGCSGCRLTRWEVSCCVVPLCVLLPSLIFEDLSKVTCAADGSL